MRKIIFFLMCFGFFVGKLFAQQILPPVGSENSLSTFRGGLQINQAIFIPEKDTTAWFGRKSDFVTKDGVLFYQENGIYKQIGSKGDGIASMVFTGDQSKTLTITKNDGSVISAGFDIPVSFTEREIFEGSSSSVKTLIGNPDFEQPLAIILNTAWVSAKDYSINETSKQIVLNFTISTNDYLEIYYKNKN